MSKATFIIGSITGGVDCAKLAHDAGMFDTPVVAMFSCVFIFAIALCGGLTALLIQDWIQKKKEQWNGRPSHRY